VTLCSAGICCAGDAGRRASTRREY
jgi:hypothetical protein